MRFAGPACLRSGAGEQVGKDIPQGGEAVKVKSTRKGMKLRGKTEQNNPQKGFEEDLGNSIKLQIILQCQL